MKQVLGLVLSMAVLFSGAASAADDHAPKSLAEMSQSSGGPDFQTKYAETLEKLGKALGDLAECRQQPAKKAPFSVVTSGHSEVEKCLVALNKKCSGGKVFNFRYDRWNCTADCQQ